MNDRALVLAGGGLAGIAWEVGVLAGIRDGWAGFGAILDDPETSFVGTSAGSVVATQVAGGESLDDLYAGQLAEESSELGAEMDVVAFQTMIAQAIEGATSPADARRRVGAVALGVDRGASAVRRRVIEERLASPEWPGRDIQVAAVDAESGELRVFRPDSGVALVDAIGASCAVPGVWPVVEIDGRFYTDGGVRSGANADLARDARRVLVLSPSAGTEADAVPEAQLAALESSRVIYADAASLTAFGSNPLDPAVRPGAARAGREQGRAIAATVEGFWG